jgi:hypothetical protein
MSIKAPPYSVGDVTTTYGSVPQGQRPKGSRWVMFTKELVLGAPPNKNGDRLYRCHWRLHGSKADEPIKPNPYATTASNHAPRKPVARGALAAEQPNLFD